MEKLIGRVTHYFSRIGVAALDLADGLKIGDMVRIRGRNTDLVQCVRSLEIEHQQMQQVGPGADVALKVDGRVREGDAVYKLIGE